MILTPLSDLLRAVLYRGKPPAYQPRHLNPDGEADTTPGYRGEHRAEHGPSFSDTPAYARLKSDSWTHHELRGVEFPCVNALCRKHFPDVDPWGSAG